MQTCALQSGSNGNCIYVEADGVKLLFDAGISGRQAALRLEQRGRRIRDVDALLLSHDHIDHTRGAGVFQRLFALPIHANQATFDRARGIIGKVKDFRRFRSGESVQFGNVAVETIRTPHDAYEGVAFVVDDGSIRVGIFTDLGHPFRGLGELIGTLDACYLESNYDEQMLDAGPYPEDLKRRIRGPRGHISNTEAAELVRESAGERLRLLVLAHLSEQNNDPEVAVATHRRILGEEFPLAVASRSEATEMFSV